MFVKLLIFAIILLPVFFLIFKFTYTALQKTNAQELVNDINDKIDEFDKIHAAHDKVKDVDLEAVRKERANVNRVLKG